MITKNLYSYLLGRGLKQTIVNAITSTDGTLYNHDYYYNNTNDTVFSAMSSFTNSATSSGVIIGTGTTPATASDYKLESQLLSASVKFNGTTSVSYNMDDDGVSLFSTTNAQNVGTEPIAVSEVGLVGKLFYGSGSSNLCNVLLDRTVLEEPIVINPGETKQLTYTIRMNYPTV